MSPILAMPRTMVKKIMGAISMLIMLIKVLLMIRAESAKPGMKIPTSMPNIMATITWNVKFLEMIFMEDVLVKNSR